MPGYTKIRDEADEVADLRAHIKAGKIPAKNLSFVQSLVDQAGSGAGLSSNQVTWVEKWNRFATHGVNPWTGKVDAPKSEPTKNAHPHAGTAKRLIEFFAKTGMTQPRVTVKASDGVKYKFSRLGHTSKTPGDIGMADAANYFGRIEWKGGNIIDRYNPLPECAWQALAKLLDDPAAAAREYGHAEHHCCFCARDLTDERSITAGYGPDCADRYGLPWGRPEVEDDAEQFTAAQRHNDRMERS